jgi:hypothetical protein
MSRHKESLVFKSIIITLVITLLVPSFVKLAHAFENHEHEICVTPQKEHFHEYDLDCEFYKFKTNPQVAISFDYTESIDIETNTAPIVSQYQFISDYQRLSFSLRGPPTV